MARAKRPRLQLEADATPGPAAAAAEPPAVFKHVDMFYDSKPSEALRCAVCLEVALEQPVGCPGAAARCGAIFSRDCLVDALATNRRCPTCRAETGGAATAPVESPQAWTLLAPPLRIG